MKDILPNPAECGTTCREPRHRLPLSVLHGWTPVVLACLILFWPAKLNAEEPFVEFLTRLRETRHYDVAEFYLEQMENSDMISPELKQQIPFRRAQVLFEKTRSQSSDAAVESWKQAANLAAEFASTATDLEQRLDAVRLMTATRSIMARHAMQQAELTIETVHQNPEVAGYARENLLQAAEGFRNGNQWLKEELLEARTSKDAERRGRVQLNRNRFLQYRFSELQLRYQAALTLPPESPEFKKEMEQLVELGAENRKKYASSPPFEMYFQLIQIRALIALNEINTAGPLLDDVFGFSSSPVYQDVRREAALEGIRIWFQTVPPKTELAIEQLENIVGEMREDELGLDTPAQIQLALARAHRLRVTQIRDLENPTTDQRTAANFSNRRSETLLRQLAKTDSAVGEEAQALMKEWDLRGPAANVKEVTTFSEARETGFNLLLDCQELQQQLAAIPVSAENDAEREQLQQQIDQVANQALAWFDRSFELADDDTPRTQRNMARVYQCQCYWMKRWYLETALIGQFLLERFPNELGTVEGAALAANALNQLVVIGKREGQDVTYEQQRMSEVCKEVLQRWPDSKEAGDLAYLLVTIAVDRGDLTAATEAVNQLSEDNPRRGNAALLVGLAHVRELQQQQQAASVPPQQIQELRQNGQAYLESAVLSDQTEVSVLYYYGVSQLAQWYNEQQQFAKAVSILEPEKDGAIQQIQDGNPLVSAADLQVNLIQSAVLAHLGNMSQTGDVKAASDRGAQLLQLLADKLADNPDRDVILQGFYSMTLSRLKAQLLGTTDPEKLKGVAQAVIDIFQPVSQSSDDWRLLYTLGVTIADLRSALPDSEKELQTRLNRLAKSSFEKALAVSSNASDPNMAAYRVEFQLGIASALAASDQFSEAQKRLESMLDDQGRNPKLQIALCQLYQDWGITSQDAEKLEIAMAGGLSEEVNGRNRKRMWGWAQLAQATMSNDKMQEIFLHAFHGLNRSKLAYAKLSKKTEFAESAFKGISKQKDRLAKSRDSIWYAKLDQLTRDLQSFLNQPVTGLAGL